MAFPTQSTKTPSSIGRITLTLVDDPSEATQQMLYGTIEVLDAGGAVLSLWKGDLSSVVAPGVATSLTAQMTAIRTQAGNELIP